MILRARVPFRICWINDNDYLRRGIYVPEIQNRFDQVHFFSGGNEHGGVKDSRRIQTAR
jgi:hypothetical protein